jgi:hypothetical protein
MADTMMKIDLLKDLYKKESKLKVNLEKVKIEIDLLEKDLNGGATLDGYISDDVLRKTEDVLNKEAQEGKFGSIEKVEINRVR